MKIKKKYVDFTFSVSRAIAYYITTHEILDLIKNETMKDIINVYKSYLNSMQLKIVELDYFSDSDDLNFKYERNINSDNDYYSNFNSESSEESENTLIQL